MFGQNEWELFKPLAGPSGVCLCVHGCVCTAAESSTVGVVLSHLVMFVFQHLVMLRGGLMELDWGTFVCTFA